MATFDLTTYSGVWNKRAGDLGPAMRASLERLRQQTQELSREAMQEGIYDKPEDTSPNGVPLWQRTGKLLNGERAVIRGEAEVVLTNAVPYAEFRHEAGKPGRRPIDPYRFAPWRDWIRDPLRYLQLGVYQETIARVLSFSGLTGAAALSENHLPSTSAGGGAGGGGGTISNPLAKLKKSHRLFPSRFPRVRR